MSTSKWDDAAVKDLTFAIIMSTAEEGNVNIAANWDRVEATMNGWGYGFTKGAMSQHWTKKVVKEFKERHANGTASTVQKTPSKTATPRKRAAPKTKTPGSGRGKKRGAAADDDDASSADGGLIADPIARMKTPRSASKKVKYDAEEDAEVKAEAMEADENMADEEQEAEAQAAMKAEKEDTDFSF